MVLNKCIIRWFWVDVTKKAPLGLSIKVVNCCMRNFSKLSINMFKIYQDITVWIKNMKVIFNGGKNLAQN